MIKVGVTGGIGSGKTTVCKFLEKKGIPVYYADERAKYILANNQTCKNQVISLFGNDSYLENGQLNRNFLSKVVFSNDKNVASINEIVHPLVEADFQKWLAKNSEESLIVKEAALLYETGGYKSLDKIIVVTAPEEIRIKRVLGRDSHRTEEQVREIISKQIPQNEKNERADFLIDNSNNLLIDQVLDILAELKK